MHPTIFSAKGGVPIVPFTAVTHKIEGLLDSLDLDIDTFDPFDVTSSASEIAELAETYLRDATKFDAVPNRVGELSEAATLNVQHLRRD